jgi:uncharacterized protein (TIGR02466 family)
MIKNINSIPIYTSTFDEYEWPKEKLLNALKPIIPADDSACQIFTDVFNVTQPHQLKEFEWLNKKIKKALFKYITVLSETAHYQDRETFQFWIQKSWGVQLKNGGHVHKHRHQNAHFSAVFYIETPPYSSNLKFVNENILSYLPFNIKERIDEIETKEGTLVIFPGYLDHYVEPSSDQHGKRFCVSYDIMVTAKTEAEGIPLDPKFWKLLD